MASTPPPDAAAQTYAAASGASAGATMRRDTGKQSMSIFKDTRTLASKVVEMVDAVMKGGEAPVNDTTTYDNGTGVIPSYLCEPVFADASNYKELLIDSGYYTEADLQ